MDGSENKSNKLNEQKQSEIIWIKITTFFKRRVSIILSYFSS